MLVGALGVAGCDDEPAEVGLKDAPVAVEECIAAPGEAAGQATYYDATGAGNCSFDASPDRMVAAINAEDYGVASWCGACLAVQGPAGEVTVRVVDKCPGCAKGDLDLSRQAFEKISPLSAGRVPITWKLVACDVQGPLEYHWKDGSSQYWSAVQIRNHRYPIAKVEARPAADTSASYKTIDRLDYNYFVAPSSKLGAGPFTFRVTDTRGHVVEDANITLGDDEARTGAAQFPSCPGA